ncbi:MFS transporter [Gulbenkiania mobilis]|uniref:MFS transporter n=1 Tax=Gulbenkiania mobilis TaxID=397457 RepID=UPI0006BBA987|nr:MFS transporter [Gulbenkiania mobilis]
MKTDFSFFARRRFLPLFGTQFLGALNDNLLKTAVIVLISFHGLTLAGLPPAQLVNVATAVFLLPFFLFSATAGKVAERYDKALVARRIKQVEVGIMLLAAGGFVLMSAAMLLAALFLMGVHSTFFGPLKYSVLPQYLHGEELVGGNGLIEMGTFIAILAGQIGGSIAADHHIGLIIGLTVAAAVAGYGFSHAMPPAPPAAPELRLSWNIWADSRDLLQEAWRLPDVRAAILGISWFWLMGTLYTTQLPIFTRLHLGGDGSVYTVLLACFSVGIGIGSVVCAKLSRGRLELGLVLVGALGLSLFGLDLAFNNYLLYLPPLEGAQPLVDEAGRLLSWQAFLGRAAAWHVMADVALLGFSGGFFTVPLYTWLQTASPAVFRSQAVAANNIVNGFYMVAGVGASGLVLALKNNVALLFLIASVVNLLATWGLVRAGPAIWATRTGWLHRAEH